MARAKKDGKFFNCYIKREISDTLDKYSEETMIPKTAVVEAALKEYWEKRGVQIKKSEE